MSKITISAFVLISSFCGQLIYAANWDGPSDGPPKQARKKVIFISQNLKNGGPTAIFRGLEGAAHELDWSASMVDGKGDAKTIHGEFAAALRLHPDAIVLGGFQAENVADLVRAAHDAKIVLAGWHAAANPGPTPDLFMNVATDALEVAKVAAEYVIKSAKGPVGAVIINDNRFDVANAKTKRMKEVIELCKTCKVLAVENVLIANADKEISGVVQRLNKNYGAAWTHTLAINDVYFDNMNFPLKDLNRLDIRNISAGDGSTKALSRIKSGLSQQVATVAEPLTLQGWQLADELNRAFAGKAPSAYITKPILVDTQSLATSPDADIEAGIPFKEAYTAIWNGKAGK